MQGKRRWLPPWQRVELAELVELQGKTCRRAAAGPHGSPATVHYWVDRRRRATPAELASGTWAQDRPSTPHRQPTKVSEEVHDRVCKARRRTGWGPRLIAAEVELPHATVHRCLRRRGLSRLPKAARGEVRRFEWPCPGDLVQVDVKRFARFTRPGHRVTGDRYRTAAEKRSRVGWEYCHSIIDDHSRLAYSELHGDERAPTVTAFIERALNFLAEHGITVARLQTDNHYSYVHNRSLRELLTARAIEHRRIPPRTPKRNGKIERYQQTLAREWAYGQRYRSSTARAAALPHWLEHYNRTRRHSAIGNRPPINRVRKDPRRDT